MSNVDLLPKGFSELSVWVGGWALATENQRWEKRLNTSFPELQAFFTKVYPYLERILDHCDQYALGELPEQSARLFDLSLMLSETASSVERYKSSRVPYSFPEEKFVSAQGDEPH